jgi:hypothetical protein
MKSFYAPLSPKKPFVADCFAFFLQFDTHANRFFNQMDNANR